MHLHIRVLNKMRKNDLTEEFSKSDVKKCRVTAALGYLCFLIPLIFDEDKQFARFHCNQSLINFLMATVFTVLLSFVPVAGPFLVILQQLICLDIAVRGIILSCRGRAMRIPVIGKITLIAYKN